MTMLTIVGRRSQMPLNRVRIATTHLQAAIAHLNNEAQRRVPDALHGDPSGTDELRLIVRALCDVVDALRLSRCEGRRDTA